MQHSTSQMNSPELQAFFETGLWQRFQLPAWTLSPFSCANPVIPSEVELGASLLSPHSSPSHQPHWVCGLEQVSGARRECERHLEIGVGRGVVSLPFKVSKQRSHEGFIM